MGYAFQVSPVPVSYTHLDVYKRQELDLLDGQAVKKFFDEEQPQYVILAAAHVGRCV